MNVFRLDCVAIIRCAKAETVVITPSREKYGRGSGDSIDIQWWHNKRHKTECVWTMFDEPVRLNVEKGDVVDIWEYIVEWEPLDPNIRYD